MIVPITQTLEIKTVHEADRALASLAECQAELDLINAGLTESVARAKCLAAQEAAPVQANAAILRQALETFAADHRDVVVTGKRKSLKLTNGSIGYKTRTVLEAGDWDDVARALVAADQPALLVCAEPEADRKALAKLTDEELALWGVARETVEIFYAAPAVARVAEGGPHDRA